MFLEIKKVGRFNSCMKVPWQTN